MARICEVCGRIDEVEDEHPYDILDVCPECTSHAIHPFYADDK